MADMPDERAPDDTPDFDQDQLVQALGKYLQGDQFSLQVARRLAEVLVNDTAFVDKVAIVVLDRLRTAINGEAS
jgi:hypothetical protein